MALLTVAFVILVIVVIYLLFKDKNSTALGDLASIQSKIVAITNEIDANSKSLKLSEATAVKDKEYIMSQISKMDNSKEILELKKALADREKILVSLEEADSATAAVIGSLSKDSANFKNYMEESSKGISAANDKIVSLSKDIADRVLKVDLEQLKNTMVGPSDLSKLSDMITAVEAKVTAAGLDKTELLDILKTKADRLSIEGALNEVNRLSGDLKVEATSREELSSKIEDILKKLSDTTLSDKVTETINALSTIKAGLDGKADVLIVNKMSNDLTTVLAEVPALKTTIDTINAVIADVKASIEKRATTDALNAVSDKLSIVSSGLSQEITDLSKSLESKAGMADLSTLSGKVQASVETIGKAVDDLKEIVKKNSSDTLSSSVDLKASQDSALAKLAADLSSSIAVVAANKADATALERLSSDLATAMANKVDSETLAKLQSDLTDVISGKSDSVTLKKLSESLNASIASLDATMATKADSDILAKLSIDLNDIIDNLKGSKADITALEKLSYDLRTALATKEDVSKLSEDLRTILAGKADSAVLDNLSEDLKTTLTGKADLLALEKLSSDLNETFNKALLSKADSKSLDKLAADINATMATKIELAKLSADMATKSEVAKILSDLGTKASTVDLDVLSSYVTKVISSKASTSDVAKLSTDLGTKANASDLDVLSTYVTKMLATKSDVSSVNKLSTDINTVLSGKADSASLTKLSTDLATMMATKADAATLTKLSTDINTALAGKADSASLTKLSTDINTALSGKVDSATLNRLSLDLTTAITAKADQSALTKLSTDLNTAMAGKAAVTAVDKVTADLLTVTKQLTDLKTLTDSSIKGLQTDKANKTSLDQLSTDLIQYLDASITQTIESIETLKTTTSNDSYNLTSRIDALDASYNAMSSDLNLVSENVKTLKSATIPAASKVQYFGQDVKTFKSGTNLRYAMYTDQGVISDASYLNFTGTRTGSITMEQMRRILQATDASITPQINFWFRSQRDIFPTDTMTLGSSESYIFALFGWDKMKTDNVNMNQVFSPGVGTILGGQGYQVNIRPTDTSVNASRFFARLLNRALQAMVQLSSRLDCILEIAVDITLRTDVTTIKARDVDVSFRVFKDQSFLSGRYQPKLYVNAVIDSSNGLIVPHGDYLTPSTTGSITSTAGRAVCPINTYMCGVNGSSSSFSPICCSFNPNEYTSTNNQF